MNAFDFSWTNIFFGQNGHIPSCCASCKLFSVVCHIAAQEVKFSIKDYFGKCDQIRSFLLSIFNVYSVGKDLFKVNSRDRTTFMVLNFLTFNGICPISFAMLYQLLLKLISDWLVILKVERAQEKNF